MVGRNDPCTCGSGKKYKKCCGKNNVVELSSVIDGELARISNGFIENGLSPREYGELDIRTRKWHSELSDLFEEELIDVLALDSYYYLDRNELWINYLKKQISKHPRKQVIEVLTSWQQPFLLFGQITQELENELIVKDELRDITYSIPGKVTESHIGEWMLGIVLPDARHGDFGLAGTDGILFIPDDSTGLVGQIRAIMKSPDMDVLDIYRLFGQMEHLFDFSPFQQQVVDLTQQYLADHSYEEQIVLPMLSAFLVKNEVKAKKPSAVAAGMIQVAHDFQLIGSSYATLKEIGAYFNVSSATVSKYREQVGDFMMATMAQINKEDSKQQSFQLLSTDMGTDPRATERFMWEMVMRSKQQSFDTIETLNAHMKEKMNEEYEPINEDEQAQLLCYKAYEAETEELRVQLTNEAAAIHLDNADVHLLLAQQCTNKVEQENHYLKAIIVSLKMAELSIEQAWQNVLNRPYLRALFSYGAWLMTEKRHKEAVENFHHILEVNPDDHQGVRWLLAAAYVDLGLSVEAERVLNEMDSDDHQAIFYYIERAIDRSESDLASNSADSINGENLNKHVHAMLAEGKHPGAFPRILNLQSGSKDEAKLIYWLLSELL
ncbi:MAG: tetratricopeptide repeat protein [Paenisporosarcina sp.]|nr:tetratricopeptide repeat protein [Paenisporosarcina sp.]